MPSTDQHEKPNGITPGRFSRVCVQTRAGAVEVRLSEGGNWELRMRREEDETWRVACTGDLDGGAITNEPVDPALGEEVKRLGALEIEPAARRARVAGQELALSKKEFGLLLTLASRPERVFDKAELLGAIWGDRSAAVNTRTLESHASKLRRKLRDAGAGSMVVNCWGVGYRLLDGAGNTTFPPLGPAGRAV